MSPPSDEYCPVKSGLSLLLHSSLTWVLTSFILGILLMAAIGKDNDIQKAMWFATGAAITAVATAYQTYQSNKRSKDERAFTEEQSIRRMKYEEEKHLRENTASLRLSAYECYLQCLITMIVKQNFDDFAIELTVSFTRIRLLSDGVIPNKCIEIYQTVSAIDEAKKNNQNDSEHMDKLGELIREITDLMKDDIGRSCVSIAAQDGPH